MRLLLVAMMFASSCGSAISKRAQTARASAYQTDYSVVWNAASRAVKERYQRIKVEDPAGGLIVSDWHRVEMQQESTSDEFGGAAVKAGTFFRVQVRVLGKSPPFRISIDGEAARYRPGFSMLTPYRHGDADEPQWVSGRIDELYIAIHDELESHAVAPAQATPQPESRPPLVAPTDAGPSETPTGDAAPAQP